MDDKLFNRRMAEVEMADAYIRLLDFAGGFGITLMRVSLHEPIPENKGEALFRLMQMITCAGQGTGYGWINVSLAFIEAYCEKHGYDLFGAIEEKTAFNSVRKDHTHEARVAAGGKKF